MNKSNLIIINIKELVGILPKNKLVLGGKEMNELTTLKNAFIEIKDDKIQGKLVISWNSTLLNLFHPYLSFLFSGLVLIVTLTVITYFWKISLHSSSISALCGGMMAETLIAYPVGAQEQVFYINMALLVFIGLVSFSRLFLKAHTLSQTVAGIALGFSLAFSIVFFQIYI